MQCVVDQALLVSISEFSCSQLCIDLLCVILVSAVTHKINEC